MKLGEWYEPALRTSCRARGGPVSLGGATRPFAELARGVALRRVEEQEIERSISMVTDI